MRSKILTAPDAGARELALVLVVIYMPAVIWLICGVTVAAAKGIISRMLYKKENLDEPPKDGGQVKAIMAYVFHMIFEIVMIGINTTMGVIRSVLQCTPLICIFIASLVWSLLMLHYSRELIHIADVCYETL